MITKLITVLKQTQAEGKEKKRKETKATKTWRKYLYEQNASAKLKNTTKLNFGPIYMPPVSGVECNTSAHSQRQCNRTHNKINKLP